MSLSSNQESEFIASSRLLMVCGLVFHHLFEIPGSSHSPRLNMENTTPFIPEFINSFFHMAFMTAVPLLSVISGYLFFHRPTINFRTLLSSRLFSIALPSWLWSALWLVTAYTLFNLGRLYGWFQWSDYGFENADVMTLINGIFGLTREPFAFQFWFVHDLLLTLMLTPVLYFLLQWMNWHLLILMAVIWMMIPYPPVFFSGNVLMFFTIGAWLSLPDSPGLGLILEKLQRYRWPLLILFTGVLTLRLLSYKFALINDILQGYVYLCALRIIGVLTASALIYHLVTQRQRLTRFFLRYSGYSFIIFAAHYPLIELLQGPVLSIPGHDSTLGLTMSWLLIPLFTIALIIVLSRQCERHFPLLFSILNGGRHTQSGIMAATFKRTEPKKHQTAVKN